MNCVMKNLQELSDYCYSSVTDWLTHFLCGYKNGIDPE